MTNFIASGLPGVSAVGSFVYIAAGEPIPVTGSLQSAASYGAAPSSFAASNPMTQRNFAAVTRPKLWLTPAGAQNTNSYSFFLTGEAVGRVEVGAGFMGLTSGVSVLLYGGTMQPDVLTRMLAGHFGVSPDRIDVRNLNALLPPGTVVIQTGGAQVEPRLAIDGTVVREDRGAPSFVPLSLSPPTARAAMAFDPMSVVTLDGDAEAWAKVATMPPLPDTLTGSMRRLIEWLRWARYRWPEGEVWARKRVNAALLRGVLPRDFESKREGIIGKMLTLIMEPRRQDAPWTRYLIADIQSGGELTASAVQAPPAGRAEKGPAGKPSGTSQTAPPLRARRGGDNKAPNIAEAKQRVTKFFSAVNRNEIVQWADGREHFAISWRFIYDYGEVRAIRTVPSNYAVRTNSAMVTFRRFNGKYRIVYAKGMYVAAALEGFLKGGAVDVDSGVLDDARRREEHRAAPSNDPVRSFNELGRFTAKRLTRQAAGRRRVKLVAAVPRGAGNRERFNGWRVADIDEKIDRQHFQIPAEMLGRGWVIIDDEAAGLASKGYMVDRAVAVLKESGAVDISAEIAARIAARSARWRRSFSRRRK